MVEYGMWWRPMARISISTVWSLCHSLVRIKISRSLSRERCCYRHWCLHASESWLTENLSAVNPLYMMSIKALPDKDKWHQFARDWVKQWVKQKQLNFLKQALQHREGFDNGPLTFAISFNTATKTPAGLYITRFLEEEEYEQSWLIGLRAVCTSTKLVAYKAMNHDLSVHKVYGQTDPIVPERLTG